jgi:hypothetical protein
MTLAERLSNLLPVRESRRTMYHGTASVFARRILKEGFIPNPRKRAWGLDDGNSGNAAFPGTYFTDSVDLAEEAASNAVDRYGGSMVVFEAVLESRTATFDEDDLMGIGVPEDAPGRPGRRPASVYRSAAEEWLSGMLVMNPEWSPGLRPEARERLLPLVAAWAEQSDAESARVVRLWTNRESPEHRAARRAVYDALKGLPARYGSGILNLRVMEPVGFRGANRIVSAVEYPTYREDEGREIPEEYRIVYGEPSPEFLRQLSHRRASVVRGPLVV